MWDSRENQCGNTKPWCAAALLSDLLLEKRNQAFVWTNQDPGSSSALGDLYRKKYTVSAWGSEYRTLKHLHLKRGVKGRDLNQPCAYREAPGRLHLLPVRVCEIRLEEWGDTGASCRVRTRTHTMERALNSNAHATWLNPHIVFISRCSFLSWCFIDIKLKYLLLIFQYFFRCSYKSKVYVHALICHHFYRKETFI